MKTNAEYPKNNILPAASRSRATCARERASTGVYRDGLVHVMARMCDTCIFRSGNLMRLTPGRVASMVRECERQQSCIPCHKTTYGQEPGEAVCRGFFEKHATAPLQVAERMGVIAFQELTNPARSLGQETSADVSPQAE